MRKFFPAANTPDGFFSRFEYVCNEKEDNKVVYIKGGSGTGKSTLMKKILSDAENSGLETEAFFCSSDPDSLDGVRIPQKKAAIVDATSPHTQDPLMPGISGKIYNVADFLNEEMLIPHKQEITELLALKKECFNKCYKYLSSAKTLYPSQTPDLKALTDVCRKFSFPKQNRQGTTRKLFASAITPKGNVHCLDNILTGRIIGIDDNQNTSAILKQLNYSANAAGFDTELFFCPMFPAKKAEHLVIKDLNLSFTTLNQFHEFKTIDEKVEFKNLFHLNDLVHQALTLASVSLSKAKEHHKKIEQIYINAMDFDNMDKTYDSVASYLLD